MRTPVLGQPSLPSCLPRAIPYQQVTLCHWDKQGWGLQTALSKENLQFHEKMQWGAGSRVTWGLSSIPFTTSHSSHPNGSVRVPFPSASKKPQRDNSATGQAPTGVKEGRGIKEDQVGGAELIPKGPVPNPD